ncbi:glycoside hydrolase family 2 TIM barrel-domain containing protein [Paenibacillus enshidis]
MTSRTILPFNTDWRFTEGNYAGADKKDYDDSKWRQLNVPHDWSIEKPFDPYMEFGGNHAYLPRWTVGWYRKHFRLAANEAGQRVYIQFEGIHNNSEVWINGHFLGNRPYGYVSFQYDLTPYILWDEENVISVKVDNTPMPPDRWYSGSGIYRNVWLISTSQVHVAGWGTYITTPEITADKARINAEIQMQNHDDQQVECTVVTKILDVAGTLLGKAETRQFLAGQETLKVVQEAEVHNPELWSPKSPAMYEARTMIYCEGVEVDRYTTPFGIREIKFDAQEGFFLNGINLKLKGVCIHHDLGCLGAAYHDTAMRRRLETLKEMGCNAIRFAHNPMAPELLDLCDRMGFLVVDEAFDKWKSSYYEHLFEEWWQQDLEAMLLRDRNHPSIIMWSVGNEVENQGQAAMLDMLQMLVAHCHKVDPTRPVTCALEPHNTPLSLRDGSIEGKVQHTKGLAERMDILGLNYQEQWYEHYRESMPDTLILGTETFPFYRGKDNRVKGYLPLNPWFDVLKHKYVIGQFVWAGIDYLGEASYPLKGWPSGLIDTCGFRKSISYLQQSFWSEEPMVHMAVFNDTVKQEHNPQWTMHWKSPALKDHWTLPDCTGKMVRLVTFTNCERVELFVNDESYGIRELKNYPDQMIMWHLPYAPGKLCAVGSNGGRQVCEHELITAGEPSQIVLEPDKSVMPADNYEIAHIEVTVADREGVLAPQREYELLFDSAEKDASLAWTTGLLRAMNRIKGTKGLHETENV